MAVDVTSTLSDIPPDAVITLVLGPRMPAPGPSLTAVPDGCPPAATGPWVTCVPTMSGGLRVSVAGNVVTLARSGNASIPAGQTARIVLRGVSNPTFHGSTGPFQVREDPAADWLLATLRTSWWVVAQWALFTRQVRD
jgi:hypothetical protein